MDTRKSSERLRNRRIYNKPHFETTQKRRGRKNGSGSADRGDDERKQGSSSDKPISNVVLKSAVEPKVHCPHTNSGGELPRKVAIERKRILYNQQDIEQLLVDRGVDFRANTLDGQTMASGNLKLGLFDDLQFEQHLNNSEWLEKGIDNETGRQHGVPAKGLYRTYGSAAWKPCTATGFSEGTGTFGVVWHDTGNHAELSRVELLFQAEDPFNFADRVAAATRRRRQVQQLLRYNLYLDCMPTEDVPGFDPEQNDRLLAMALSSRVLRVAAQHSLDTSAVIRDASLDFNRVMNKIAWNSYASPEGIVPSLYLPDKAPSPPPPEMGTVTMDTAGKTSNPDFMATFSEFAFRTLATEHRLALTVAIVMQDCNLLRKKRLFAITSKARSAQRLNEFVTMQRDNITRVVSYFDREWMGNICTHILKGLKDVDKGNFKLNETKEEYYKKSKLKHFFKLVNFITEDALRDMVETSVKEFVEMILTAGPVLTEADTLEGIKAARAAKKAAAKAAKAALKDINAIAREDENPAADDEDAFIDDSVTPPLLLVDLSFEGSDDADVDAPKEAMSNTQHKAKEKIFYRATPEECGEAMCGLVEYALSALKDFKQVQRRVMDKLFWPADPVMKVPSVNEGFVKDALASIHGHMERCYVPINEYLRQYHKYMKFVELDVDEYVAKLMAKHSNENGKLEEEGLLMLVEEMKTLVIKHRTKAKALGKEITPKKTCNLFLINCSELRERMIEKHKKLSTMLLDLLGVKNVEATAQLLKEFRAISENLEKEVTDIESLTEMSDYISEVQTKMKDLTARSEKVQSKYDILDEFQFKLSKHEFQEKWTLFGFPKDISDQIEALNVRLTEKMEEYSSEMQSGQQKFASSLKNLENEVLNLSRFTDISKVDMVIGYIINIKTKIDQAKASAMLFNSREGLFNLEVTEYPEIAQIMKNFTPYSNLWETVASWNDRSASWRNDHFEELDSDLLEKKMMEYNRKLLKSRKYFAQKEIRECEKIVKSVFAEVDAFKPYIPAILAMRNPGMRPRHWAKINEALKLELDPSSKEFTLQNMIKLKVTDNEETLTKIGEAAGKEFQLEKALIGMKKEWEEVELVVEAYRDTGTSILKEADVIIALLDEHVTMTQAMSFSTFKGPFEEEIDEWEKNSEQHF
jgi:dynein heavy chain